MPPPVLQYGPGGEQFGVGSGGLGPGVAALARRGSSAAWPVARPASKKKAPLPARFRKERRSKARARSSLAKRVNLSILSITVVAPLGAPGSLIYPPFWSGDQVHAPAGIE